MYEFFEINYMDQYSCLAEKCDDNCCNGWVIYIDKKTYEKYMRFEDKFSKKILKYTMVNEDNTEDDKYAVIIFDHRGHCPFLSNDLLCQIHLEYGAENQSVICANYPRIINAHHNVLECVGTVSCPEIARVALLQKEPIVLKRVEYLPIGPVAFNKSINPGDTSEKRIIYKYFSELREFTIEILQSRQFEIWDRMAMINLFYKDLSLELNNFCEVDIPQRIKQFHSTYLHEKGIKWHNHNIFRQKISALLPLFKVAIDEKLGVSMPGNRYLEFCDDYARGIGNINPMNFEMVLHNFFQAHETYYSPFMRDKEYIIENYLVNHVYISLFPNINSNCYDQCILIYLHYLMIMTHLVGLAAYYRSDFGIAHVIRLIQSYSRVMEHSGDYLLRKYKIMGNLNKEWAEILLF